jgi:hypothetical protein
MNRSWREPSSAADEGKAESAIATGSHTRWGRAAMATLIVAFW